MDRKPLVYLIGSMEHSKDGGKDSFEKRSNFCKELGYEYINPVENEEKKTGFSAGDAQGKIDGLRKAGYHDEVRKIFDNIWIEDLMAVKKCDFLWGHIEPTDKLGGTIKEVTVNTFAKQLGLLARHKEITDKEKGFIIAIKAILKLLLFGNNKPIYVTCFGSRTGINGSVEHMINQSGGRVFGSWKETLEFFEKTYGKFEGEKNET